MEYTIENIPYSEYVKYCNKEYPAMTNDDIKRCYDNRLEDEAI